VRENLIWLSSPQANQLILAGLAILVMALSLVMTMSRSGIISFTLVVLTIGALLLRRQNGLRRRPVVAWFVASTAVLSLGWAGFDTIFDRFAQAGTVTFNGRTEIWRDTIHLIRDFPLAGTGLNTYAAAIAPYRKNPDLVAREAHSDYLQLAAEGGVLLVAAALILFAFFANEVRRSGAGDGGASDYWIRVGALTGLAAIGVQELTDFSLQMPGNVALFVVLCSIAAHRRTKVQPDQGEPARVATIQTFSLAGK
jgi:O-antigen ligase